MAEGGGFEPPVRLLAQRFSRPPHSTTLASLRGRGAWSKRRGVSRRSPAGRQAAARKFPAAAGHRFPACRVQARGACPAAPGSTRHATERLTCGRLCTLCGRMARGRPGPRFNRLWIVPISGANPGRTGRSRPAATLAAEARIRTRGKMFAVIKTGGKQYRVAANEILQVEKLDGAAGDQVTFGEVLMLGGDAPTLGAPLVSGAAVLGEIVEQKRGRKIII